MAEPKAGAYAKRAQILWLLAVVAVAVVVYVPSLRGDFLLDDRELVVLNPASQSLSQLPKAFTTPFLYGFDNTDSLYYRPLTTISYQINNALSPHDAFACRVTNLMLNALLAALVYLFAAAITKNKKLAGAAALTFAVLPCHAESVTWISGRTDIIAGLFMLAAFLAFLANYRGRPTFDWRLAVLASLLFGCSIFAKESGLMLPVLIGVYALTIGDSMKRNEALKWLLAAVVPTVIYFICRRYALGVTADAQMGYLVKERLSRIGLIYATYLRMLFLPQEARPVYDGVRTDVIAMALKMIAGLAPIGLVTISIWARKRVPVIAFGAAWMFVTLLPVSDIVPLHGFLIAERFAYLPSIGSALILGWLFCRLTELRSKALTTLPLAVTLLGVGFLMYCGATTVAGSQHYRSNLDWAKWVAAHRPKLRMVHVTASSILQEAGYRKEAAEELETALDLGWNDVSKKHKADWKYKLGQVYVEFEDYQRAAHTFRDAVELDPTLRGAWISLARVNMALGRYGQAESAYERADALNALGPDDLADFATARRRAGGMH